ncbi:MAG TPA: carbon-nitrogen hydrolase [Candidatus Thermoplasmatota archaeon]|nr:carbon-nitrogen hydrolase [Candidatus Thermoplasmatota archaeon]
MANAKERKVTVGLVQMQARDEPASSLKRAIDLIGQAADKGAEIVLLQELFLTKYFCQTEDPANFDLAESVPGPTTDALAKVAKARGVVIVASLFERRAAGVYHNTAAVIDADGTFVGKYRKMHIPDDPRFYEKYYFTPGDLGFKAFDTKKGRIGVLVCWDQWYPEAARLAALAGAEILFYPTAIGYWPGEPDGIPDKQHQAWETIQRAHGVANGVYVAVANRIGVEDDLVFWGRSFVSDPLGTILAKGSDDKEEVVLATLDLGAIERTRQGWPFLRDRRIDAYGPITSRYLD